MTSSGGSSHIGSVLSMADIVAVLYDSVLRFDPERPDWQDRDRFLLSKGHAAAGVYAALAESRVIDSAMLATHCRNGSLLSGHISHKGVPGVEFSTGSLGHALPVGTGMALAGKLDDAKHRVFVLLSDGELDEGSNWEAIMFAAHHRLDNLVAIVDYNGIQSLASVEDTLRLEPLADKWRSFGWCVAEANGHDCAELDRLLSNVPLTTGQPTCVLAHTTKGKGVSFMEGSVLWHYRTARDAEFDAALDELLREDR